MPSSFPSKLIIRTSTSSKAYPLKSTVITSLTGFGNNEVATDKFNSFTSIVVEVIATFMAGVENFPPAITTPSPVGFVMNIDKVGKNYIMVCRKLVKKKKPGVIALRVFLWVLETESID